MALASMLLATAPYEDHSAPLKPQYLKLMGAAILRAGVMAQIGERGAGDSAATGDSE
jgi:hypothetical protein